MHRSFRLFVSLGVALVATAPAASPARAAAGSGTASIAPAAPVTAGNSGTWTVTYVATEDFGNGGGLIEIGIPAAWTAPQKSSPTTAGYVTWTNLTQVDSVAVVGRTIRVYLGSPPRPKFKAGDAVSVVYGSGGGPASARAQTAAPSDVPFTVSSDPFMSGAAPIASSPTVPVVPGPVARVRVVDANLDPVGNLLRTTDADTTHLYLRGYDAFDNPVRLVAGTWSVTGGIGSAAPGLGTGTVLSLSTPGAGYAVGDSGSWADSTGLITVTHGSFAALGLACADQTMAGLPFAAAVEARDADGNRVTGGPGSSASLAWVTYADSTGAGLSDPDLSDDPPVLVGGYWTGAPLARRTGGFFLAARDTVAGIESPRQPLAVAPAPPDRIVMDPDTLRLTAGIADTVTVRVYDALGNRSPLGGDEPLALWTDRPAGVFFDLSGAPVFEMIVPAASDSIQFLFRDIQATAAGGRVRAIDANPASPFLGTAEAAALTVPNVPAGLVSLTATPGTVTAGGADSALVASGAVRDAYGNVAAPGERFTLTGVRVAPTADADPAAPGTQALTDTLGALRAWVRAGSERGAGSLSVASERGAAAGAVSVMVRSGPPGGAIALSAAADSVAADSVATIGVSAAGLADALGNTVEDGEPYTVATTLGAILSSDEDAGTPGLQVRAANGAIAFTLFGGDQLGTAQVSATSVRGSASGLRSFGLVAGAVDPARSLVAASAPAVVGAAGSVVAATLLDRVGHPIAGVPAGSVSLAVSGVPAVAAALDPASDASGSIRFRVTTTVADTATIRVTARGVPLDAEPLVVFGPGPLDRFEAAGPAGPLVAGTGTAIAILARDAFGNALPSRGGDVLRPAAIAGAALLPDSVLLVAGAASIPFTPTLAVPLAIEVRDDSGRAATYGPVSVAAGAPHRVVALAAAPTIPAGDSLGVSARVSDALGNSVSGAVVLAEVIGGGGSAVPGSDATDAGGLADFTLRAGPAAGDLALRFLAAGSAAPDSVRADTLRVTVTPGGAASVEVSAGSAAAAGDTVDVLITLRDAYGNVATQATPSIWMRTTTVQPSPDHVDWAAGPGAAGSLADSAASDGARYGFAAADSGRAALRLRDTRAETLRVRASGTGIIAGESNDVVIAPAAAAALAVSSGDGQSGVVDRELPLPLRVAARDSFGNAAPGTRVVFSAASGGAVDVTRGGPPDSVAIADPGGIATCEAARLGTAAGPGAGSFLARLEGVPAVAVSFSADALPDTASLLAIAPPSLGLLPDGTADVVVTARDRFGNAVPGTALTVHLGATTAGRLESAGATSGGAGSQSGATDATGALTVRYHAPTAAPAADSVFARGTAIGPVAIRAATSPGPTAALRVEPDSLGWVAGVPVAVRVRAVDGFGNPVSSDAATVTMQPSGAVVWTPASGPLVAGVFTAAGRDTLAESITVAAVRAGGGVGAAGPVVVRPALPAGTIGIAASRDTLTADGRSVASVTLGPVRDAFGNVTPAGTLVQARIQAGSLLAADARPELPGLDLATDGGGLASLLLVAAAAPGVDTLEAAAGGGSAAGRRAFTYLPPPSLAYAAGTLSPGVVSPGSGYGFALGVTNPGAGTIRLGPGTTLSFGAGAQAFTASLPAAVDVGPGAAATLAFAPTVVSAGLPPGAYAPSLRAVGVDATGEPFDFYPALAGAQVSVAGLSITPVAASPSPVPLGHPDLTLYFDVRNLAGSAADLVGAGVVFSAGAFVPNGGPSPALPLTLPPGGTVRLAQSVRVPSSGLVPGTVVSARLDAAASFSGLSLAASSAPPLDFTVTSAAQVVATPWGASPQRYLRGRTFGPRARVRNLGAAAVTLLRDSTRLALELGGTRLESALAANAVVAAGDSAELLFDSLAVPVAAPRGLYAATLALGGTESGQAYRDTIPLDPATVALLDPPLLSCVPGTLLPDTVSAGQTRALEVEIRNAGDVPFDFDAATELSLGAPLFTSRSLGVPVRLDAGATVRLLFPAGPLGTPGSTGTAAAALGAVGLEDGRARSETLAAGTVVAVSPAAPVFVSGTTVPAQLRPGTVVNFSVDVQNAGGSAFVLDPARSRLEVSDGVDLVAAAGAGAPFALEPGARATLSFPAASIPAALASQPYPVALLLSGSEWGLPDSVRTVSADSEVVVLEPLTAIQVRALDAGGPVQVAPGAAPARVWGLELTPLVPSGGSAQARLAEIRITVLLDGVAASPGSSVASLALRDASGTVLAQAVPGAQNPVPLALPTPRDLGGGPDSLYLELGLAAGAGVGRVALRLAAESDLRVADQLTGSPVPVRGGGGLPFTPLTSPDLTLFARAHGYPNPFRPGREAVRLSYVLRADAPVRVTVRTLFGDLVREMSLPAGGAGGAGGLNEVLWDGRNGAGSVVRPGVYVARIEGGGVNAEVKIGVLR